MGKQNVENVENVEHQHEAGKRGIALDLAGTAGPRREHAGIAGNMMVRGGILREQTGVLGNTREPPGNAG